jgi:hypothetical protein
MKPKKLDFGEESLSAQNVGEFPPCREELAA